MRKEKERRKRRGGRGEEKRRGEKSRGRRKERKKDGKKQNKTRTISISPFHPIPCPSIQSLLIPFHIPFHIHSIFHSDLASLSQLGGEFGTLDK